MRTRIELQSIHSVGHKHFKFDLDRKLKSWLKFEPHFLTSRWSVAKAFPPARLLFLAHRGELYILDEERH